MIKIGDFWGCLKVLVRNYEDSLGFFVGFSGIMKIFDDSLMFRGFLKVFEQNYEDSLSFFDVDNQKRLNISRFFDILDDFGHMD